MKQILLYLLCLVFMCSACSKSDDNTNNSPYPGNPASPVPADNQSNVPNDITLTWNACIDPQGDPVTYTIVVDTNANLTTPVFYATNLNVNTFSISGLDRLKSYYWKVTASDNHNNFTYGPVWKFTTKDFDFGTFTDPRDNKTYRTIKIGDKTWMADNLAYISPSLEFIYPNYDPAMVAEYGVLYNFGTTIDSIAPPGWHIPNENDFIDLGYQNGGHLKMAGTKYWDAPNSGADNSTGFSAKAAGNQDMLNFHSRAFFIASSNSWGTVYYYPFALLSYSDALINTMNNINYSSDWFSVRCVKD